MANRAPVDPVIAALANAPQANLTAEERAEAEREGAELRARHAAIIADPSTAADAVMSRVRVHFRK